MIVFRNLDKKYNLNNLHLRKYLFTASALLILLFFIKGNNVRTSYAELPDGSARNYDAEMNKRYDEIYRNDSDSLEVDSIEKVPESFFLLDITSSPKKIYNQGYQLFFNKKAITIKK